MCQTETHPCGVRWLTLFRQRGHTEGAFCIAAVCNGVPRRTGLGKQNHLEPLEGTSVCCHCLHRMQSSAVLRHGIVGIHSLAQRIVVVWPCLGPSWHLL